jgi:hypothetical protein
MTIKKTTTHTVSFTVEAFWNEEGGMGHAQHGDTKTELVEVIQLLELARIADPNTDWTIVCDVTTTVS